MKGFLTSTFNEFNYTVIFPCREENSVKNLEEEINSFLRGNCGEWEFPKQHYKQGIGRWLNRS